MHSCAPTPPNPTRRYRPELLGYTTDLPDQALTYRTGFGEFVALRSAAEARSGCEFDVRDFHEAILSAGTLPFPALRQRLDRVLRLPTSD